MTYSELLESLQSPLLLQENGHSFLDEMDLQARWFSGLFGNHFTTTDGRKVEILQFGFWNRSAGPDFQCCAIKIEDAIVKGSIELDLSVAHWFQHEHHLKPSFNDVVLHVVCSTAQKERFNRTSENKHIPTVVLTEGSINRALQLKTQKTALAQLGRCSFPLAHLPPSKIEKVFEDVLLHRCYYKAKRTTKLITVHGLEQATWVQLAETLGYKNNSFAFASLAHRIPIKELKEREPQSIMSILFGAADFLQPQLHLKAPNDSQEWIESLWGKWWTLRQQFEFSSKRKVPWKLSGVRPVNHPQRRLAALAMIAQHWNKIFTQVSNYKEFKNRLLELQDAFWSYHYTLTSKRTATPMQLVGSSRIEEFYINHILPPRLENDRERTLAKLKSFKAPTSNDKVKRAADRIFGDNEYRNTFLKKAWHHQALIQIYDDFCLSHLEGCETCPFPEQLKEWASHI